MGLDINGIQSILYAKVQGVDFSKTAMIGRQGLHLSQSEFRNNLVNFGFSFDESIIEQIFTKEAPYAEDFFLSLGAKIVHSYDNSDYEGASHVHDMNKSIPEQHKQQYSVVCDSGSLEHIFNFPVAIKNCMEMVQVGGHYVGITPANNFMGHGFYQFSPELFYSVFTAENGFELVSLIAFEEDPKAEWYSLSIPAPTNVQGALTSSRRPIYLFVIAKRVENVGPMQSMPQQSNFITVWNSHNNDEKKLTKSDVKTNRTAMIPKTSIRYISQLVKHAVMLLFRRDAIFNPFFFQPLRRTDGMTSPGKILQRPR